MNSLPPPGKFRRIACCLAALLLIAAAKPLPGTPGVTAHEIAAGTHMDLSGPLAAWGQAARNGIRMAFDETNAEGGVHGRMLRLIAYDDKYDAALATARVHELVTKDRVFAILSPLGTPTVQASMREALDHRVLHLFPLMSDEQSYLPLHRLKFATAPPYAAEIAAGIDYLLAMRHAGKVGVLYQDNVFGRGVRDGAAAALAPHGQALVAAVGFSPGATELSAEVAQLKAARADIVVLGSVLQDTLAALRAAYSLAWHPIFLCSSACYAPETATLGGWFAEGLYAVGQVPIPYPDDREAKLRAWAAGYEKKFGVAPTVQALQAYLNARLFVDALIETGAAPTPAGFARTLETMGAWLDPQLGGLPVAFAPEDHLGVHTGFLARVHNSRWVTLTGALDGAQSSSKK